MTISLKCETSKIEQKGVQLIFGKLGKKWKFNYITYSIDEDRNLLKIHFSFEYFDSPNSVEKVTRFLIF